MKSQKTMEIIGRFYEAVDAIIAQNKIRGISTYCRLYDIDRRNFYAQRKDLGIGYFQVGWLYPLVNEYGVNARWLILGRGKMFINEKE